MSDVRGSGERPGSRKDTHTSGKETKTSTSNGENPKYQPVPLHEGGDANSRAEKTASAHDADQTAGMTPVSSPATGDNSKKKELEEEVDKLGETKEMHVDINLDGLTTQQVTELRAKYGWNEVKPKQVGKGSLRQMSSATLPRPRVDCFPKRQTCPQIVDRSVLDSPVRQLPREDASRPCF